MECQKVPETLAITSIVLETNAATNEKPESIFEASLVPKTIVGETIIPEPIVPETIAETTIVPKNSSEGVKVTTKKRPKSLERVDERGMPLDWIDLEFKELLEITNNLSFMWKELKYSYGWSFKFAVFLLDDGQLHDAFIKPAYHGCGKAILRQDPQACTFLSKDKVATYIKNCWRKSHN